LLEVVQEQKRLPVADQRDDPVAERSSRAVYPTMSVNITATIRRSGRSFTAARLGPRDSAHRSLGKASSLR
jgi:hypothetical protein